MTFRPLLVLCTLLVTPLLRAELQMSSVFGDHMVLQQKQSDAVWGWDTPGTTVTVSFAGQSKTAVAGQDGWWALRLDPLTASAEPATLTISGTTKREIHDVLVGEVWLCSGQSNMTLPLEATWNAEVESAASLHPSLRLLTVPNVASQEVRRDFKGEWTACTPETSLHFSAVALYYGRYLHQILGVPVGLINNAWGGSNIEAWLPRSEVEDNALYPEADAYTKKYEGRAVSPKAIAKYDQDLIQYAKDIAEWQKIMAADPLTQVERPHRPKDPREFLTGNSRLGNLYHGVLQPLVGFGIKGVIWYQGESNVGRFSEYGGLLKALIQRWRKDWQQGDFPFYWVQLPYHDERPETPDDSAWARVREGQTQALSLPNTGQAVTVDLGETNDLHPRDKVDVAARLVRWALANDYGVKMPYRSPQFKAATLAENKYTVTFDHVGTGLFTLHWSKPRGFAVCGEDQKWFWAEAAILDTDKVLVWCDAVKKPVALRYGWADNPQCSLYSREGLPVTPFRTDDFKAKDDP